MFQFFDPSAPLTCDVIYGCPLVKAALNLRVLYAMELIILRAVDWRWGSTVSFYYPHTVRRFRAVKAAIYYHEKGDGYAGQGSHMWFKHPIGVRSKSFGGWLRILTDDINIQHTNFINIPFILIFLNALSFSIFSLIFSSCIHSFLSENLFRSWAKILWVFN